MKRVRRQFIISPPPVNYDARPPTFSDSDTYGRQGEVRLADGEVVHAETLISLIADDGIHFSYLSLRPLE